MVGGERLELHGDEEPEAVEEVSSPTVEAVIDEAAEEEAPELSFEETAPPPMPRLDEGEAIPNGELPSEDVMGAETAVQGEAPARKPRPRRVASAAKGRTRAAGR